MNRTATTAAATLVAVPMLLGLSAGPAAAGTTWNNLSSAAATATADGVTLAAGTVPTCRSLSFWQRVVIVLGGGSCR